MHRLDTVSYLSLCCSYEQNWLLFGHKARNKSEFDAISKAKNVDLHEQKPYLQCLRATSTKVHSYCRFLQSVRSVHSICFFLFEIALK